MGRGIGVSLVLAALAACGSSESDEPVELPDQYIFGGDRPVELNIPISYTHTEDVPLLVVLHGYSASGYVQAAYTGFNELVDEAGVLMIAPDGTVDAEGNQFWNATDACCDFFDTGVDDVAYISSLIEDISDVYRVDPDRVYLFGHSNGGYMSYRMACERADLIAGIASLAGATFLDATACDPSEPVSVLQIHGTQDTSVQYDGSTRIPSAQGSIERWAGYDGCTGSIARTDTQMDLDGNVPADESVVDVIDGCPSGVGVELWTIQDGSHVPALTDAFRGAVWQWLDARPK